MDIPMWNPLTEWYEFIHVSLQDEEYVWTAEDVRRILLEQPTEPDRDTP